MKKTLLRLNFRPLHLQYVFVAVLLAAIAPTASGWAVRGPLERPPALRVQPSLLKYEVQAKPSEDREKPKDDDKAKVDTKAVRERNQKAKADADKAKAKADNAAQSKIAKEALEGEDPAAVAEEEALSAVPKTLPPAQEIDTEETEKGLQTAADLLGVHPNQHGSFENFAVTAGINLFTICVCMLIFSGLRLKYPLIYSGNVLASNVPLEPASTFGGWAMASWATTTEMAAETAGLDSAMVLEFFNMCIKLLAIISIPMVCIMCPMHFVFGGKGLSISEITSVAMGNVIGHHPWLYYLHAIAINLVTLTIIQTIYRTMAKFQVLRFDWLKKMDSPRCITALVEGIPEAYRSDAKLKEFFIAQFKDGHVQDAVIVKDDRMLLQLYNEQTTCRSALKVACDQWEKAGCPENDRPTHKQYLLFGEEYDTIKTYEEKLLGPEGLDAKVVAARKKAREASSTVGGINTGAGFVTFQKKKQAAVATSLVFSEDREEWIVSIPPPAQDVLWVDLMQDAHVRTGGSVIAYSLVILLYAFFVPLIVIGTNLTALIEFGPHIQPIWAAFAPGLALMLLLGFLPTILLLIFRSFLTMKADAFAQHKLQIWYFFFLLFFVVLVTTIGRNLVQTFAKVIRRPELGMWLMAKNIPQFTHFYMDWLLLQTAEQAVCFLRHVSLAKFLFWRLIYEEPVAKELAEPEDQDYYGIGSRSARFTIVLLVGIIFSTLSPLIGLLTLGYFLICRLFYGYLIVYAETKKPDLGGVFFYTMLNHLLLGTGIYNVLMIGVLCCRAPSKAPMLLATPALLYTIVSYRRFAENFVWHELPFTEIDNEKRSLDSGLRYVQPEFIDDDEKAAFAAEQEKRQLEARNKKLMKAASYGLGAADEKA
jgi:hypothetical protein